MRAYPRPHDFRYHDSDRLARLSMDYGLSKRQRRSRPPSANESATAALIVGASLGAAWMLGRHYAARHAARS